MYWQPFGSWLPLTVRGGKKQITQRTTALEPDSCRERPSFIACLPRSWERSEQRVHLHSRTEWSCTIMGRGVGPQLNPIISLSRVGWKMLLSQLLIFQFQKTHGFFQGGPVVKNPPANAGIMGLIPGLEGFHLTRSNWAHAPQLLSPRSRPLSSGNHWAHVLQLLNPTHPRSALQLQKPPQWEARATREWTPLAAARENLEAAMTTQRSQK